eukprot:TRINITY_DN26811_c0_g1_i1.p1 TRINITY_DN26811_c0_g1~~TRINITY_DN26811_c0_g1_i1.p1  ORF type:complete len:317 (+),score=38.96 TRINITY_DN26811_c0_g1_i1:78-1028(+)
MNHSTVRKIKEGLHEGSVEIVLSALQKIKTNANWTTVRQAYVSATGRELENDLRAAGMEDKCKQSLGDISNLNCSQLQGMRRRPWVPSAGSPLYITAKKDLKKAQGADGVLQDICGLNSIERDRTTAVPAYLKRSEPKPISQNIHNNVRTAVERSTRVVKTHRIEREKKLEKAIFDDRNRKISQAGPLMAGKRAASYFLETPKPVFTSLHQPAPFSKVCLNPLCNVCTSYLITMECRRRRRLAEKQEKIFSMLIHDFVAVSSVLLWGGTTATPNQILITSVLIPRFLSKEARDRKEIRDIAFEKAACLKNLYYSAI